MDIPIYRAGEDIPPNQQFYYLLGKEGVFLHKTTHFYAATIKVDGIGGLGKVKEQLALTSSFRKIPWEVIKEALTFFRAVYAKHKAEGIVLLGYDKAEERWFLIPVEQEVQGAHVDYKVNGSKGAVGTIHSHPSFGAFYSGTDDHDDDQFDGIHIVLGQITEEIPKIEVSAVVNGNRFTFKPDQVIAGIPRPKKEDKTHEWMDKFVKKKTYSPRKGYHTVKGVHKYYRTDYDKSKSDGNGKDSKDDEKQLKLLSDDQVEEIIKRNQKGKEVTESDPFAQAKTSGGKEESDSSKETDFAAECHFELVKTEVDNLSLEHLQDLADHVTERLDILEDREYFDAMIADEEEAYDNNLFCPVCERKTDFGSQKWRWCSTCQMQISPEDCIVMNDNPTIEVINEDDETKVIDMRGREPGEDPHFKKLKEEFVENMEEEEKKRQSLIVEPYKDGERIFCRICHSLTIPFTDEEEDKEWRWCVQCQKAVNRRSGMLSAFELRQFHSHEIGGDRISRR
jgi:hypothetical protein